VGSACFETGSALQIYSISLTSLVVDIFKLKRLLRSDINDIYFISLIWNLYNMFVSA